MVTYTQAALPNGMAIPCTSSTQIRKDLPATTRSSSPRLCSCRSLTWSAAVRSMMSGISSMAFSKTPCSLFFGSLSWAVKFWSPNSDSSFSKLTSRVLMVLSGESLTWLACQLSWSTSFSSVYPTGSPHAWVTTVSSTQDTPIVPPSYTTMTA